jgi:hypothetical protein
MPIMRRHLKLNSILGHRNGQNTILGHTNHRLARIGSLSGYAAETRDDLPLAAFRAANGNRSTLEHWLIATESRLSITGKIVVTTSSNSRT